MPSILHPGLLLNRFVNQVRDAVENFLYGFTSEDEQSVFITEDEAHYFVQEDAP